MPTGKLRRVMTLAGLAIFLAAAGLAGVWWFTGSKVPRAEVTETRFDFGEYYQDQAQSHTFTIRNTGSAPLLVERVKPDCQCTVAHYDREIPPGGQGQVTLTIKANSLRKKFSKKTRVCLNDPAKPQAVLTVTGNPRPTIEVEPRFFVHFRGKPDKEHRVRLRLISYLPEKVEIKEVRTDIPDKIGIKLNAVEPGKAYVLEVANKVKQEGRYHGKIEVVTSSTRTPHLLIRVFGLLGDKIKSPNRLAKGRPKAGGQNYATPATQQ